METLIDGVPGFHDLFQLGKINHLATDNGEFAPYDRVIVDTPATGHAATLFSAASSIRDMTRVGLVYDEAKQMADVLVNPEMTNTIVVTYPEALPIQETIEFIRNRAPDHPHIGGVIINRCMEGILVDENEWESISKSFSNKPELARVAELWHSTLIAQKEHIELLKSEIPQEVYLATVLESNDGFDGLKLNEVRK